MEAGPSLQDQPSLFGEAVVTTPRGDSVKVPFFKDPEVDGTIWVVPLFVFWQVVVQEPIMSRQDWRVEVGPYHSRNACSWELGKLHNLMYLSTLVNQELMVPLDDLVWSLEQLSLKFHCLEATFKSLQCIHNNSSGDVLNQGSVLGGFAQPQPCPLTSAQAQEGFSLRAEFPEYFEDGTLFMQQVDAAMEFFDDPPVGCGLKMPIEPQTFDIWLDSAQQYLGFLRKYEGLEPSLEHLRNTTLLAKFHSFRLARGNGWNTMKIEFVNLGNWIPFIFFPGNFPGLPAVPDAARLATKSWIKEIVARALAEAGKPENRRRETPTVHLAQVWEAQEQEWTAMEQEFEVRRPGWCCWLALGSLHPLPFPPTNFVHLCRPTTRCGPRSLPRSASQLA